MSMFLPCEVGGLFLKNRFAMAPMTRRKCPNLLPGQDVVSYYSERAKGVGLVITEGVHIDDTNSVDLSNTPAMFKKEHADAWKKVVEEVHKNDSKIIMQLWHTGVQARNPVGPVDCLNANKRTVTAMTKQQMDDVKNSFVNAAILAETAGFDGVQLHGAHGYLLDSFIAPTNTRTDGYGGSFEERIKYPLEIVKAVKSAIKPTTNLQYRISQWWLFSDYYGEKYNPETLKTFVTSLEKSGVHFVDVSTHTVTKLAFPTVHPTRTLAGWVKSMTSCGVIAVGGVCGSHGFLEQLKGDVKTETVKDPTNALNLIGKETDILSLGRSIIANPDLVQKLQSQPLNLQNITPFNVGMLKSLL